MQQITKSQSLQKDIYRLLSSQLLNHQTLTKKYPPQRINNALKQSSLQHQEKAIVLKKNELKKHIINVTSNYRLTHQL